MDARAGASLPGCTRRRIIHLNFHAMKRPSFQFYPADWLSDYRVLAMTCEQRGAYIQILATMWLEDDCSLPNDLAQLAAITKCDVNQLPTVVQCFVENGSKITHKRLLAERQKQDDWRDKSKKAGMASAKSRSRKPKNTVQPTFNQRSTKCQHFFSFFCFK